MKAEKEFRVTLPGQAVFNYYWTYNESDRYRRSCIVDGKRLVDIGGIVERWNGDEWARDERGNRSCNHGCQVCEVCGECHKEGYCGEAGF